MGFGSLTIRLAILIVLLTGSMGFLVAESPLPSMVRYRSTLNFEHEYPQAWLRLDRSNTEAVRSSHTNFVLNQIDSLVIKAAFMESSGEEGPGLVMVNFGPKIDRFDDDAMNLLEKRFQTMLLPPGALVKTLETSYVRQGLKRMLVLTASVTNPGQPGVWSYYSLTVNGEGRSFTFTLRGKETTIQRLQPVLSEMTGSLVDNFNVTRSISRIPRWSEIVLILLFSLLISGLIIRLRDQVIVASRHKRRGITFFQLFLIVAAVLVGVSHLLTSCQAG